MSGEISFLKFEDVDRFREVLRGWDTEPTQLSPGRLTVCWDQIAFEDLVISRLRTDKRVADSTAYQPDHVGFVVCLASKKFCGMPVPTGSLVVFGPGREYRHVHDSWESFEICMSTQLFETMGYAPSVSRRLALGPERCVMQLSPLLTASFREWSANFLAPFRGSDLARDPYWSGVVRERTLGLLYEAMHENGNVGVEAHPLSHVQGWNIAARALDCIDRHAHERLPVHDLSGVVQCTPRSLQTAFQAALGVTPTQYMLARRLRLAQRELLAIRNGPPSVTKAATEQGFTHFGRFSGYYKALFGELPSETLRRREIAVSRRNGKL